MKRALLLLACLLASLTVTFAQNTVKGTVLDGNGDPIVGAYVVVQGSNTLGSITDESGAFSIANAPSTGTLTASCIGYSTLSVPITASPIRITLQEDAEFLDEVVVTAQGLTRKQKAIGYSAQTMTNEELTTTHNYSLGNSLAGKVAGAQVWSSGGSTFNEGRIILRGTTSYSNMEGSEPIYVIDGAIVGSGAVNMDDVESINILKGPSATALYGSRGANGAVIITTKKAKEGQSHIEFSHTTAAEVYYNHANFQKSYGGGDDVSSATAKYAASNEADPDVTSPVWSWTNAGYALGDGTYVYNYGEDVSWGARFDDKTPYRTALSWDPTSSHYGETDTWSYRLNLRDLTRVAWTNNTNIAFTKATKGMSTRVAFTNVDRPGIFQNSKAVRRTFSISTQVKPTSWLNADISYRYRIRRNQNAEQEGYSATGNYVCDFIQWGHTNVNLKDLKDWQRPDGSWRTWNIKSKDDLVANFHDNPFAVMENYTYDNTTQYHLIAGDVYATLPLNFRLGARINEVIQSQLYNERDAMGSVDFESYFRTYQTNTNDLTAQGYLTWGGQFAEDRLSIEAAAFAETRSYNYYYLNSYTNGGLNMPGFYNLAASNSTYSTNNSETHYKTRSFFGNATIGWDDLIYLDGSIRYDLDSRLPADNNGYLYGGGSLSFMVSKLINARWLNFWKIRGSLAQVGSTISAYSVTPTYSVNTKLHGATAMYEPTTQVNTSIRPTISTSYEVGTEFKMFNNRFYGDINFYLKNTKDDIINATVLNQSGYSSRTLNAGLVQNKGFEILLGGTPVATKDFEWNLSANIAKNINKLIELAPDQHEYQRYGNGFGTANRYWYIMAIEGQPIGTIQAVSQWLTNDKGQLILRDGTTNTGEVRPTWETNKRINCGNIQPDFTGGFNTSLRFKNFTLSAALDFMIGGQIVSWTNLWGEGSGLLDVTAAVNDKGVNVREPVQKGGGIYMEGVDADGNPKSGYMDAYYYYSYKSTYNAASYVYDKTYVKLRELSLKYQLPKSLLNKLNIGLSSASIAFVATNPWLIYSAVPNIDPSEVGGASYNGLEGGQALSTRSFGLTLNVTF